MARRRIKLQMQLEDIIEKQAARLYTSATQRMLDEHELKILKIVLDAQERLPESDQTVVNIDKFRGMSAADLEVLYKSP